LGGLKCCEKLCELNSEGHRNTLWGELLAASCGIMIPFEWAGGRQWEGLRADLI
jgi:hypothetical protein